MIWLKETQILRNTKKEIEYTTMTTLVQYDHDSVAKQKAGQVNSCNCPDSMNSNRNNSFKLHQKQRDLDFVFKHFPIHLMT